MKRICLNFSMALMTLGLAGCNTCSYCPYQGKQEVWRVSNGAFVYTSHNRPVYMGFPNKPYEVLGILHVVGRSTIATAGWQVIEHHADAAFVLDSKSVYAGNIGYASAYASPVGSGVMAAGTGLSAPVYRDETEFVLIRFTTNTPPWETNQPASSANHNNASH